MCDTKRCRFSSRQLCNVNETFGILSGNNAHFNSACRGKPGKTGHSGNMGNRYMQRIVLLQSVFSLPTIRIADYYTHQLVCNSSRGLKQSFICL